MPVVWQISALHLNEKTLLSGVILNKTPYHLEKKGSIRNLVNVISYYLARTYASKPISINSNGKTISTKTDENGSFEVLMDGLQEGELSVSVSEESNPLPILQDYPITFKKTKSAVDVISDIDDTIMVSHSGSSLKRIFTLAFKTPKQRKAIEFTNKLLAELEKNNSRIMYVSKSESDLFRTITTFIKLNHLPSGKLFLTPHLRLSQLLNPQKEVDFKFDNIHFLIEKTAPKRYILFGDDSQRDVQIYFDIAQKFPQRILKIYIRQTKPIKLEDRDLLKEQFNTIGISITYFQPNESLNAANELKQLKL